MKKKMFCLALLVGLLVSGTMTAYATGSADADNTGTGSGNGADSTDTGSTGGDSDTDSVSGNAVNVTGDWVVTYTADGKMSDNLGSAGTINDRIATMQPGDTTTVSVALANGNSAVTHWYMKNTITKSMEDAAGMGGAYTYELVYIDPAGARTVLYTSETVGGDDNSGLLDVDSRLGEYFYLGVIANGQSGRIDLTVGLDGETQGNSYQSKVANLSMNFAVEPQPGISGGGGGGGKTHHRTVKREVVNNEVVYIDEDGVPLARDTDIVRTSDEMNLLPYVLVACISGILLLVVAFFGKKDQEEEKEGGAVR